jgi:hypothetical protein
VVSLSNAGPVVIDEGAVPSLVGGLRKRHERDWPSDEDVSPL